MSAFLVWVVLPALVAVGMLLVHPGRKASALAMGGVSLWLALAAVWLPPGSTLSLRGLVIYLQPQTVILGRVFDLRAPADGLLVVWFLSLGCWLMGMAGASVPADFPAWSTLLAVAALAVLRLSSMPVGAVGMAALLLGAVTFGIASGAAALAGLRLAAQVVWGGLLLLFAWFVLAGGELVPLSAASQQQALTLLAAGFGLLLLLVPLHGGWMRFSASVEPYVGAFLGWLWGASVTLLALTWVEATPWLRESAVLPVVARWAGTAMVAVSGLIASADGHPRRWIGAAVLAVNGWGLLALGSGALLSWSGFLSLWWPHLVALLGLGVGLSRLSLDLSLLPERPLSGITVLTSLMALAGVPFLASFPPRLGVFMSLFPTPFALLLAFLGSATWLRPTVRVFTALFPLSRQSLARDGGLAFIPLVLLLAGWLPSLLFPLWQAAVPLFPHLLP